MVFFFADSEFSFIRHETDQIFDLLLFFVLKNDPLHTVHNVLRTFFNYVKSKGMVSLDVLLIGPLWALSIWAIFDDQNNIR